MNEYTWDEDSNVRMAANIDSFRTTGIVGKLVTTAVEIEEWRFGVVAEDGEDEVRVDT